MQPVPITRKQRWLYAMLWPLLFLVVGYVLVLGTAQGAGSSIGFRALGALIFSPAVLIANFLVNLALVLPFVKSKMSALAFGVIAPLTSLVIEYAYLWQVWKDYPDIG